MVMTVLPSCLGFTHSFFNLILNAKAFVYIARVSFCTYLVHLMVLEYFIQVRSYDLYYNTCDIMIRYVGWLVISVFLGALMTMIIEVPCSNMLKLAFKNVKTKSVKKIKMKES